MSKLQAYWHIHHDVLCEFATWPIENRIAYIQENKPEHEIETRLRLLRPVKGALPKGFIEAWVAYDQAWVAYEKDRAACDKAWVAYGKAWAAYKSEIEALHEAECPNCPWNGKTIFPKPKETR